MKFSDFFYHSYGENVNSDCDLIRSLGLLLLCRSENIVGNSRSGGVRAKDMICYGDFKEKCNPGKFSHATKKKHTNDDDAMVSYYLALWKT